MSGTKENENTHGTVENRFVVVHSRIWHLTMFLCLISYARSRTHVHTRTYYKIINGNLPCLSTIKYFELCVD